MHGFRELVSQDLGAHPVSRASLPRDIAALRNLEFLRIRTQTRPPSGVFATLPKVNESRTLKQPPTQTCHFSFPPVPI
jgi:hypothetical protein